MLANVAPPQPANSPSDQDYKMPERVAAAFDFLGEPRWKVSLDEILSYYRMSTGAPAALETLRAVGTLKECASLAHQLAFLIINRDHGYEFLLEKRELFRGRVDPGTGRVTLEPHAHLGRYHDVLHRALRHPKMDARRFKLCAVCTGFFYQRRLSSRVCSRKCVNVLMAREHYHRVQTALQLKAQGKNVSEIAVELGIKPNQVRRYLVQRRKRLVGGNLPRRVV
jgi:hypothetical protein